MYRDVRETPRPRRGKNEMTSSRLVQARCDVDISAREPAHVAAADTEPAGAHAYAYSSIYALLLAR